MSTKLRIAIAVGALVAAPFGMSLAADIPEPAAAREAVEPAGADLENVQFGDVAGLDSVSEAQEAADLDNIQDSSQIVD